jgi:hypothetical protein
VRATTFRHHTELIGMKPHTDRTLTQNDNPLVATGRGYRRIVGAVLSR